MERLVTGLLAEFIEVWVLRQPFEIAVAKFQGLVERGKRLVKFPDLTIDQLIHFPCESFIIITTTGGASHL